MTLQSINPVNGALITRYEAMTPGEVRGILTETEMAFQNWRRARPGTRGGVLTTVAARLRSRREALARLMALEMGKPLAQGRAEIDKCARTCEHFAERAEWLLLPETVATEATRSYVAFEPLGVLLAIMPWNFPFWQFFRCAAPALTAGNAVLLKHASNVTGCALAIEELFRASGGPESLVRTLVLPSAGIGPVIEDPGVQGVALTGSTPAGRAVASRAGAALKKTVLELGGSDPYVVLADADVPLAAQTCVASRLINGGQSCIAAKRFIVDERIRVEFEREVSNRLQAARPGDPLEESVTLGPLARVDLREELHRQVERSIAAGARLLLGGQVPPGPGAFYPPTLLTDVRPGMAVFDEETFGPVAVIVPARDQAEAIRLANTTEFGLGAAVFTRDVARGERIAREELQAGSCFVNAFVISDPRLPFGGIRHSGYGRELSHFGLREFVNVKTVLVK